MKNFSEAVENIVQMFTEEKFPAQLARVLIRRADNDIEKPSDRWSILNQLIMLNTGKTTDARTYKQWNEVGRYVKKGAKAFQIIAPIVKKVKTEDNEDESRLIGFRGMSVFAVENTDGKDIAIADYTPKTVDINAEKLIKITEKLGCKVSYLPYGCKVLGTYNPSERKIILRSEDYDVLAHEVGHFLHDVTEGINSVDRNTAEVIAELTSAVLCEMNNIHGYERQSFNYIREYSHSNDAKAVIKAINKVLATVEKSIAVIIKNQ